MPNQSDNIKKLNDKISKSYYEYGAAYMNENGYRKDKVITPEIVKYLDKMQEYCAKLKVLM